jgi:hypothetical protein
MLSRLLAGHLTADCLSVSLLQPQESVEGSKGRKHLNHGFHLHSEKKPGAQEIGIPVPSGHHIMKVLWLWVQCAKSPRCSEASCPTLQSSPWSERPPDTASTAISPQVLSAQSWGINYCHGFIECLAPQGTPRQSAVRCPGTNCPRPPKTSTEWAPSLPVISQS